MCTYVWVNFWNLRTNHILGKALVLYFLLLDTHGGKGRFEGGGNSCLRPSLAPTGSKNVFRISEATHYVHAKCRKYSFLVNLWFMVGHRVINTLTFGFSGLVNSFLLREQERIGFSSPLRKKSQHIRGSSQRYFSKWEPQRFSSSPKLVGDSASVVHILSNLKRVHTATSSTFSVVFEATRGFFSSYAYGVVVVTRMAREKVTRQVGVGFSGESKSFYDCEVGIARVFFCVKTSIQEQMICGSVKVQTKQKATKRSGVE